MFGSRFVPPRRRLAIFLTVFALVATLSPGLVLAANGAPHPNPDTITTAEGVPATGNVLTNDVNNGDDPMVVVGFGALSPTIGTLAIAGNGDYTFTPAADWNGSTSTTYDVSNGKTKSGVITITVTPVQDPPVANDDTVGVDENTATDVTAAILLNDTDADNDPIAVSAVSNATGGSVDLTAGVVTFTPTTDVCGDGAGSFDYTVSDGNGGSDGASVTVDITCNAAPDAVADTVTVDEDTPTDVTAAILLNDTDADNDPIAVSAVSNATGGSVDLTAGVVTFSPDLNLCGTGEGSFDYDISDGNGGSDSATATVDITCENDAPVAVDDTGAVAFAAAATDFDVVANDTDIDTAHGSLSVVSASVSASAGSVSVVGNQVRFTPLGSFTGLAVISYTVSDGSLQDTGSLEVTVGPDNIPPVASKPTVHFGSGRVNETAPLLISWAAIDVGTGVASYEVQVSVAGGAFTNVYTGAATSVTKFYKLGKKVVFRMRATDVEGNVSAWATAATRKTTAYQRNSTKLIYTGTWTKVTSAGSSGTGYQYTRTLGKRATLTFRGREVLYIAPKTSGSGYVKVAADGKSVGRFNLRAATTQLGRIIARKTWTTNGLHTIRITNDQNGRRTSLDAFIVLE